MSSSEYPDPTAADHCAFLRRAYFGDVSTPIDACVDRAYRDFNRTLHGMGKLPHRSHIHERARVQVRMSLEGLAASSLTDQAGFDAWHQDTCLRLGASYAEDGFPAFGVGQAQKWLNMAFKYAHVFGEERLPGFARHYRFGHVPLDNIILDRIRALGAPQLSAAWSRLRDYSKYLGLQHWIRQHFPHAAPLAVEFRLWGEPATNKHQ